MKNSTLSIEKIKPLASISLDLDNLWSYMKSHGEANWEKFPTYLDIFIPHVLEVLNRFNLKITFFVVGQDVAADKNKDALRALVQNGHEIGNHSFYHDVWMHKYSRNRIKQEILNTENAIFKVTGTKPLGYRGPGFTWSATLFEVLAETKYLYDASTLPTFIGPLARRYFFQTADLTKKQKELRRSIYGKFRDGFKPVKPYILCLRSGRKILEIPITTMPFIKLPFHLSYLIYLSRFSTYLMILYLKTAIMLCKLTSTEPSFLLHPLDLLGGDLISELAYFPGMDLKTNTKVHIFNKVMNILSKHYKIVNMSRHAQHALKQKAFPI